ncbi:uncharacterized protein LOC131270714 [Anopheles coustani]|uniref:uncharacterized protein LOC131270714 n=1 Tax=Anopheles coustani TaxID=139045 RepID=UPI0026581604|nr:uncharacterized protein LOC131270714 [Anopheles coustani]
MKCTVVGIFHQTSRTVTFVGVNDPLPRTDAAFREGAYELHYKVRSPLLDLQGFNIVEDVIVGDRLHLIDLGVMRKLLYGWAYGKWGAEKWSEGTYGVISDHLTRINLPSEIHRKFRTLDDLKHWKGSEYASFLHYGSVVILNEKISPVAYEHFMLLYCAVTLLSSSVYQCYWDEANEMLKKFVSDYKVVYGDGYVSSNIHNLLHVADEVQRLGPLHSLNAYPFENELQHMKKLLRNGRSNLEQFINRLSELDSFNIPKQLMSPANVFLKENQNNVNRRLNTPGIPGGGNGKNRRFTLYVRDFMLTKGNRDGWFRSTQNDIIQYWTATKPSPSV